MTDTNDRRAALVLAGGGITGGVYQLGVLAALDDFIVRGKKSGGFDHYVGISAGSLVAAFLAQFAGGLSTAGWVNFTAPVLGMLLAGERFRKSRHGGEPRCAKLHHHTARRCIFRCGYRKGRQATEAPT